ncbi:hypothetical protein GCM10023094_41600 [Rhodococcus olei]|uniref:Secreted protein n=1 Tax=Rhodococcus olei TaxID=2161675 RepID=A0ABP8PGR4_9NOCA
MCRHAGAAIVRRTVAPPLVRRWTSWGSGAGRIPGHYHLENTLVILGQRARRARCPVKSREVVYAVACFLV